MSIYEAFKGIDLIVLSAQKHTLVRMLLDEELIKTDPAKHEHVQGLVNMFDSFQDYLVDELNYSEDHVFTPMIEQDARGWFYYFDPEDDITKRYVGQFSGGQLRLNGDKAEYFEKVVKAQYPHLFNE